MSGSGRDEPSFPDRDAALEALGDEGPGLDIEALLGGMGEPREHHYVFAHVALPSVVHRGMNANSVDLRELASSDMFRDLWAKVGENVDGQRLSEAGLRAEYIATDDGSVEGILITMPEATQMSEAIAAAIVRVTRKRMFVFKRCELRYLTLELGMDFDDQMQVSGSRTVLCEWTADGAHHNMGTGPAVGEFGDFALAQCGAGG